MEFCFKILWWFIPFMLGIIFKDFAWDPLKTYFLRCAKNRKVMRKIKTLKNAGNSSILSLAEGFPYFRARDHVNLSLLEGASFVLHMPSRDANRALAENKRLVLSVPCFRDIQLQVENEIDDIITEVDARFVNRTHGCYFNGVKYGVMHSDAWSRAETSAEDPILTLSLFKTDYFTQCVIENLLEKHRKSLPELSLDALNRYYRLCRTSLGISLIIKLPSTQEIILTKRSKHCAYSEGDVDWIYVSVTESFSDADIDEYRHRPDVLLCVKRGLLEELGVDDNMYQESSVKIYNLFFEKDFFQDGLVVSVDMNPDVTFDMIMRLIVENKAQDAPLEIGEIFTIPANSAAIGRFVEKHRAEMRAQTLFALESYRARL